MWRSHTFHPPEYNGRMAKPERKRVEEKHPTPWELRQSREAFERLTELGKKLAANWPKGLAAEEAIRQDRE